jgi:hypothetical protein
LESGAFFCAKYMHIMGSMKTVKKTPPPPAGDDLHSAVLDFLARGRRAQEAVDRILAAEPDHRRTPRPKGHA